jgi:hypothetical protein
MISSVKFSCDGKARYQLDAVSNASLAMMKRVLDDECTRQMIRRDSIQGEELSRVIMNAFLVGTTDGRDLVVLVRNLNA